nr:MAG TPA: hypothetical protein [Caudoviricetes sp.]
MHQKAWVDPKCRVTKPIKSPRSLKPIVRLTSLQYANKGD